MKKIITVLICLILLSCKNDGEEKKLLYNQLIEYRNQLKFEVKDLNFYISERSDGNKKITDSLLKISSEINNSYEKVKYGERNKIIELRNKLNKKYNLHENFETENYSENVSDTVFNRLMEIDFLKLERSFQNFYLLKKGCI